MRVHRELVALTDPPGRPGVLVLRALGLGDLLTVVPALRALRRGLPEHRITLATPDWLAPLVRLTGAVDTLHPTADLSRFRWSAPPPDLAVNLHGSGPQSLVALQRSGARQILTHRHHLVDLDGLAWDPDQHEVHRWCRLLEWMGLLTDPTDLRLARPGHSSMPRGAVVIHPGAAAPARRWPSVRFATVARELSRRGQRVVITGSRAERALGTELADRAGLAAEAMLAGELDLGQLAALVSDARLVVCGDTGVGHLASAYGTPSVLLFGPTSPARWGPPPAGPHLVLWAGTEGDPHAADVDPGLLSVQERDVLAAIDAIDEWAVHPDSAAHGLGTPSM